MNINEEETQEDKR